MALNIGGVDLLTMEGTEPSPLKERHEDITRPMADGHALRQIGKRGGQVKVRTEADVDSVSSSRTAYRALIGTFVTVTFEDTGTLANVFVWDVDVIGKKKVLTPVGGLTAGAWVFIAEWTLQGM